MTADQHRKIDRHLNRVAVFIPENERDRWIRSRWAELEKLTPEALDESIRRFPMAVKNFMALQSV